MLKIPRWMVWSLGGMIGLIVLVTLVALVLEINPPVKQEPTWDSPQTKALAQRACYDCHSNETVWPLYDKLPLSSWLAVFDTIRGRSHLNFSEWSAGRNRNARDLADAINSGAMPPNVYTLMHAEAILNAQEKQQLVQGLQNSLK